MPLPARQSPGGGTTRPFLPASPQAVHCPELQAELTPARQSPRPRDDERHSPERASLVPTHEARAAPRPGTAARGAARGGRDARTSSAGPCATPCSACRSRTSTSRCSGCRRSASSRCWRRTAGWTPSGRPSASTSSRASKASPGAVDVALPRRDSKVGPGHRGIAVEGDPGLSVEEAARRRDFTMNAMLFDPADRRGPRPLGRPARPRGPAPARGGRAHLRGGPAARAARRAVRRPLRAGGGPGHRRALRDDAPRRAAGRARLRGDREAAAQGATAVARPRPAQGVGNAAR